MEAILKKEIILNKALSRLLGAVVFVIFMILGAFVKIPLAFSPVPITLQTFFVLLSGAFLGSSLGSLTQGIYLLLGILGLPVFSGAASGIFYLSGPTGGYLIGFILAAFFVGRFIKSAKNLFSIFFIFSFANFIILVCGFIWLGFILSLPLKRSFLMGFLPFIPGDLLKIYLAAILYLRLKNRIKEIF